MPVRRITRRNFLAASAGVALAAAAGRAGGMDAAPPPNIVFILSDDLGYGDLACYGNKEIESPNLDALAAGGIRFTNCYAASTVCSPSRAAVMTGRIPQREGIADWIPPGSPIHLNKKAVTTAALLKEKKFATCHVGKWHLCGAFDGSQPTPADHGFDHWFCTLNNAQPSHENPENFWRNGEPVGPLKGFSSELVADEAVRWLNQRDSAQPFFLNVWFHEPHEPIATSKKFLKMYPEEKDANRAAYFGNVSQLDHAIGVLVKAIRQKGQLENTLIWFMSDNGPEGLKRYGPGAARSYGSAGPLRGKKISLWEGGIRVPGIIHWPHRIKPQRVIDEPIWGPDVLPTVCDLTGVNLPADDTIDGQSIAPLLQGQPIQRRQPFYWQYLPATSPPIALRSGNWKLLTDAKFQKAELYDLSNDPAEERDRAAVEKERTAQLLKIAREVHESLPPVQPASGPTR